MKKILIYLFPIAFVLSLAACNSGETHDHQAEKDAHKVANITWRDLTNRDTIELGDTSRIPYVFFNSGWKDAHLVQCVSRGPNCECEVPDHETIPGGSDTVWVTSIPSDTGGFVRYIDITHNSPKQPKFLISLFLQVKPASK